MDKINSEVYETCLSQPDDDGWENYGIIAGGAEDFGIVSFQNPDRNINRPVFNNLLEMDAIMLEMSGRSDLIKDFFYENKLNSADWCHHVLLKNDVVVYDCLKRRQNKKEEKSVRGN